MKRVLWVEDRKDNLIEKKLFDNPESEIIERLDTAINLINEDIYGFDTIVLDIDFDNGIEDINVIKKLFLQELDLENINNEDIEGYIHTHGGYLYYLYLLVNGYPSNQVAFLTGNPVIKRELEIDTIEEVGEIANFVRNVWEKDSIKFLDIMEEADIYEKYKENAAIEKYYSCLNSGDYEGLRLVVQEIKEQAEKEKAIVLNDVGNTSDKLLDKFRTANLKLPKVMAKVISGENTEVDKWIKNASQHGRIVLIE